MEIIYKRNRVDWHQADIIAALRKAGWSLRRLSQEHQYHPRTLSRALWQPYFTAEQVIANAIGVSAVEIWPSRYPRCGRRHSIKRENVFLRSVSGKSAHG